MIQEIKAFSGSIDSEVTILFDTMAEDIEEQLTKTKIEVDLNLDFD